MSLQNKLHFLRYLYSIHWSLGIFQVHHVHPGTPSDLSTSGQLWPLRHSLVFTGTEFSLKTIRYEENLYACVCYGMHWICNIQYIPGVKQRLQYQKCYLLGVRESQNVCASMQWEFLQKATHSLKLRPFDITINEFHFRSKHFSTRQKASCLIISTWFQSTVSYIYIYIYIYW